MSLDTLWRAYELDKSNEKTAEKLCARVQKLARIVLAKFKIGPSHRHYMDFMQDAYITFFELIPTYIPDMNTLDGYFMTAYKREVGLMLKEEIYFDSFVDKEDDSENPLGHLLASELERAMKDFLSDEEWYIFDTYMRTDNYTIAEIAEEEGVDFLEMRALIGTLRDKVRNYLLNEEHYDFKAYGGRKDRKKGTKDEVRDGGHGV